MNTEHSPRVFFLDDDPLIHTSVHEALQSRKMQATCTCFARADECFGRILADGCDLLIMNIEMPGVDGIELLRNIRRFAPSAPIVVLTGDGNVPIAVRAMKLGAFDVREKPLCAETLLSTAKSALSQNSRFHESYGKALTNTEREVLQLILESKTNKEIAEIRHRSIRTIEEERKHIMQKLGARNLVELVIRATAGRRVDTSEDQNLEGPFFEQAALQ